MADAHFPATRDAEAALGEAEGLANALVASTVAQSVNAAAARQISFKWAPNFREDSSRGQSHIYPWLLVPGSRRQDLGARHSDGSPFLTPLDGGKALDYPAA